MKLITRYPPPPPTNGAELLNVSTLKARDSVGLKPRDFMDRRQKCVQIEMYASSYDQNN